MVGSSLTQDTIVCCNDFNSSQNTVNYCALYSMEVISVPIFFIELEEEEQQTDESTDTSLCTSQPSDTGTPVVEDEPMTLIELLMASQAQSVQACSEPDADTRARKEVSILVDVFVYCFTLWECSDNKKNTIFAQLMVRLVNCSMCQFLLIYKISL